MLASIQASRETGDSEGPKDGRLEKQGAAGKVEEFIQE
jgi:hypothetical protein